MIAKECVCRVGHRSKRKRSVWARQWSVGKWKGEWPRRQEDGKRKGKEDYNTITLSYDHGKMVEKWGLYNLITI